MKDKVIVFASQQYGNYWSGLGSYATWLIDAMPKQYSIYVICPGTVSREAASEVNLITVKGAKWDPTHGKWFSLSQTYAKEISRIAEQKDIRFIHFTDAREAFFSVFTLAPQLREKIVGTLHDFYFAAFRCNPFFYTKRYLDGFKRWIYYFFVNRIERLTFKRIPYLISNTEYVRDRISRAYGVDRSNIKTIYIGLPGFWLEQAGDNRKNGRKKNQLLFVGGNYQRKGLLNLARAVVKVKEEFPDLRVTVIGKDPNQHKIEKALKKIGCRDVFDFEGFVPADKMADYYRKSTALVMPAQIEAYGLVFLEAVACACPVIGTAKGGTSELFDIMGTGHTVDPDDITGIADHIKILIAEEDLQKHIDESKVNLISLVDTVDQTKKYLVHLFI